MQAMEIMTVTMPLLVMMTTPMFIIIIGMSLIAVAVTSSTIILKTGRKNAQVLWDRQLGAPSLGSGSVVALRLPPAEEVPPARDRTPNSAATPH